MELLVFVALVCASFACGIAAKKRYGDVAPSEAA